MALQTASTANATSVTNTPAESAIFSSLVMAVVDTEINAQALIGNYKASFTLAADVNGRTKPVELIQSDQTKVNLDDLINALVLRGYRVSFKALKAARVDGTDRVKLTVAWDV